VSKEISQSKNGTSWPNYPDNLTPRFTLAHTELKGLFMSMLLGLENREVNHIFVILDLGKCIFENPRSEKGIAMVEKEKTKKLREDQELKELEAFAEEFSQLLSAKKKKEHQELLAQIFDSSGEEDAENQQ
jgi:hypothetical protein